MVVLLSVLSRRRCLDGLCTSPSLVPLGILHVRKSSDFLRIL